MRVAFYAPLKQPDHPVPSGDRAMARLLMAALRHAGHRVDILSTLRSYRGQPGGGEALAAEAKSEVDRIAGSWRLPQARPDLLFTYHLYYKAPDLLGPVLAARFGLPYLTAEASYAAKRQGGPWGSSQAAVVRAVQAATLNLCFTANDRAGLAEITDAARLLDLPPFLDTRAFPSREADPAGASVRLVTVAMMRAGDKRDSYRFLAAALQRLGHLAWRLTVVGDGPERAGVEADFAGLPRDRIHFAGALSSAEVAQGLTAADVFVWPGFNEAFGIGYLEAEASGLPVVAIRGEGTPSVVRDGETGLLTPPDPALYAAAIARLIEDAGLRRAMGAAASRFVHAERSLPIAAVRLDAALTRAMQEHGSRPVQGAA